MDLPPSDPETTPTPWSWLRPFGGFLLLWPLFGLLALEEMGDEDWSTLAAAILGPAALGVILLAIERVLSKGIGTQVAALGQPVPTLLRDLSNVAFTCAVLVVVDMLLVSLFEDASPARMAQRWHIAVELIALGASVGVVLRGLSRLITGPARRDTLGLEWAPAPGTVRLLGYLTLVPMLLVLTVMLDYLLQGRPYITHGEFALLLGFQLLGQRSAMARPAGAWARTAWEAELRRYSLLGPWWLGGALLLFGSGLLMLALPFLGSDPRESLGEWIVSIVVLAPLGVLCLVLTVHLVRRHLAAEWGNFLGVLRLRRRAADIVSWTLIASPKQSAKVVVRLDGDPPAEVWLADPPDYVLAYLEARWPR